MIISIDLDQIHPLIKISFQENFPFLVGLSDVDADRLALEPLNGDTLTRPKCSLTAPPLYCPPPIANCAPSNIIPTIVYCSDFLNCISPEYYYQLNRMCTFQKDEYLKVSCLYSALITPSLHFHRSLYRHCNHFHQERNHNCSHNQQLYLKEKPISN